MPAHNELERYRRLLRIASTEIKEGRPDAALELLRPVTSAIESRESTLEWAELPLVIGYALMAKKDEAALSHLKDALARTELVHDPPAELKIRVYKHLDNFHRYGDFATLVSVGRQQGFTAREQLDVWNSYRANAAVGLKAARKFGAASEKYFLNLLRSKRNERAAK